MRLGEPHVQRATKVTWTNQAGGDWATASNWSGGAVPNSNDTVSISTTALETITHSTGSDTVFSLSVGNDIFELTGGSLATLHGATFNNGFIQTGGTFTGGLVTIRRNGTLTGGSAEGSTTLSVSGTAALANYTLGGASVLKNAKVIDQAGQITIGDNTGVNAGIVNGAGAVYDIAGDFGVSQGAASASITNAGTFAKTAGNGLTAVNVSMVNTGTISVLAGGDLQFNGPSSVIGGVLTGGGEVSFAGSGGNTLTLGTATIGAIGLYNTATLNLAGSTSVLNGALYDQSSGNNLLALGAGTLTVKGASLFEGNYGTAYLSGSGGLVLDGATTTYNAVFGGSLQVTNEGNFSVTGGGVLLGDGSGGIAGITNATSATLQFTGDQGIGSGNNSSDFITNSGLLEKSGGGGTSDLGVVVTNAASGTIDAATGSIQIGDSLANTGTITGAGQVFVTGGATLSAGTVLSVAEFGIYDAASVTLATSLSYGGVFNDSSNGNDALTLAGTTLTLTGAQDAIVGNYGTADVNGTGSVVVSSGATLIVARADFGGSVALTNRGAVNQTDTITLGDGSGQTVVAANAAGAVWTISDGNGLNAGNSNGIAFSNAGTFQKLGGGGTSSINLGFTNQSGGTIDVASGSIQIAGGLTNIGTVTGAGQLYVTGSATFSSGTALTVGEFGIYNTGYASFATSLTYGGVFNDSSSGNDTLNLNAATLTLSGMQDTIGGNYGTAEVNGTGKLALAKGGTLTLFGADFGGTVGFTNSGAVQQTGVVEIGDGSGNIATITNAKGATWTITNDTSITLGAATASNFANLGTVTVNAGGGQSVLSTDFVNQTGGVINISSGSLGDNYLLSNAGTISGNDFAINGGGQVTLDAGSKITTSSFDLYSNASLTLTASQSYGGTLNDYSNGTDTINLNANTLALTGNANFVGAYGNDVITGSGTLSAAGTGSFGSVLIGGTANFTNSGTLLVTNNLQIGDGSGNAATFVNGATGVYDIVNDNGGIGRGASALSNFTNSGLFEKTAGTGTNVISTAFVNNGTITVTSGTLEFTAGSLTNNGTINGVVSTDQYGNVFITHH